jgi:hypothetical protein
MAKWSSRRCVEVSEARLRKGGGSKYQPFTLGFRALSIQFFEKLEGTGIRSVAFCDIHSYIILCHLRFRLFKFIAELSCHQHMS